MALISVPCVECGRLTLKHECHLRARIKSPTCSRQCNGARRGREWAAHGWKGPKARTPESYARAAMRGPRNPAWKGGVTLRRPKGNYSGVRYVRAPEWARPMARSDGYVMEHRLVMATMLGRLLTRTEVVHHRNHNPADNRPENLEWFPTNSAHKRAEGERARSAAG